MLVRPSVFWGVTRCGFVDGYLIFADILSVPGRRVKQAIVLRLFDARRRGKAKGFLMSLNI